MTDSRKKDGGDTASTKPLVKAITTATLLLYALGWGAALAWQSGWEPSVRASYGYQLGWVTCLAACTVALVFQRGHHMHESTAPELHAAEAPTDQEVV